MQILKELTYIPDLSLALGFFDGVHKGHQAVINNAVNYAHENNLKSAVVTFLDHPHCYFYGSAPKYILTRDDRAKHLANLGVDYLIELDFGSISGLTAEDYLRDILVKHFKPRAITTGWNHNFGYKKSGNVKFLEKYSKKFDYEYFEIPPQKADTLTISSTAIREFLTNGEIEKANEMLGYNFTICGKVEKGQQIGRTIGFPTANIIYPSELIELSLGVYSVSVKFNHEIFKGITNFGVRPTVSDTKQTSLETHILDFDKDIYDKNIEVKFLKMIRPEKKFDSLEALKHQITHDIQSV